MTAPTLDLIVEWQEHLRLAGKSGYTVETWGYALQRAHDALPYGVDGANREDLQRWLANPRWSRATRASYRSALINFYRWACDPDDPRLESDPTERLPRIRRSRTTPKPCTDAQLAHALAVAQPPYRLWIFLAAYAGLRCIEIARLRREDIAEAIHIRGKGERHRAVPAGPDLAAQARHLPPGPVVERDPHAADPEEEDRRIARRISRDGGGHLHHHCGLPGLSMHRLRHWYLSTVLHNVGNIRVVQQLAGHASLDSTMIYTAVSDQQLREAVSSLPRLGGGSAAEPAAHP